MAAIVAFLVVHVVLALIVPKSLRAMIVGPLKERRPMSRIAQSRPRRRSKAPDQGRGEAVAGAVAAAVPARRREPRRAGDADRLRHHRRRYLRERAARHLALQRPGAGLAVQSEQRWRRNIRKARSPGRSRSTPITAEDEAPEVDGDNYQLEIGGLVDNKKPWTLRRALQAAGSVADHAPRLRRRLERDRLLAGREAVRFPQADRRRHHAPNMSGSSAPKAIPTPSTCRPRCIRRRN